MTCRKLFRKLQAFLLLLLLLLALSALLSTVTFASDNESPETAQGEQQEIPEVIQPDTETVLESESLQDQEFVQDQEIETEIAPDSAIESNLASQEAQEIGKTFGQYEPYSEYIPETIYSDTDSEILLTLKSIEYQMKIMSGAMVLIIIIWFIWLTIYKPIKSFLKF